MIPISKDTFLKELWETINDKKLLENYEREMYQVQEDSDFHSRIFELNIHFVGKYDGKYLIVISGFSRIRFLKLLNFIYPDKTFEIRYNKFPILENEIYIISKLEVYEQNNDPELLANLNAIRNWIDSHQIDLYEINNRKIFYYKNKI